MFKLFDKNGDGVFDQLEFETAFTVLQVDFKVADLRKLIALSDTNHDGLIDLKEFNNMLYGKLEEPEPQMPDLKEKAKFEILTDDEDSDL